MSKSANSNPHKTRFLLHCLSAALMCIAAFVWIQKSPMISFALLGASGIYAFAARREFELAEPGSKRPAVEVSKFDRNIFKK
jgi:hypothetical protein